MYDLQKFNKILRSITTKARLNYLNVVIILLCALSWLWLLTVSVADISESHVIASFVSVLVFLLATGLSSIVFIKLSKLLKHQYKVQHPLLFIGTLFSLWALTEFLLAWVLSLICIGAGFSIDSLLPFSSLAPWIMHTPLSYAARLLGYFGLSAFVITILVALFAKKTRRFAPVVLTIGLVIVAGSWWFYRDSSSQSVNVVFTAEHLDAKNDTITTNADLVVFPEYGLDGTNSDNLSDRLKSQSGEAVHFVGSQAVSTSTGVQNVLVAGSTSEGIVSQQPKKRLIPGGEYLPYALEFALKSGGNVSALQEFELNRAVVKGAESTKPYKANEHMVVGAEACASILAPHDYRELTKEGATILTNSASLQIFRSKVFDIQHLGMAKFMAVANHRPFVQSANSSQAYVLDFNGNKLAAIEPVGAARSGVKLSDRTTPYTAVGEWPIYLGLGVVIIMLMTKLRSRATKV